jgi:hypothetical protein
MNFWPVLEVCQYNKHTEIKEPKFFSVMSGDRTDVLKHRQQVTAFHYKLEYAVHKNSGDFLT